MRKTIYVPDDFDWERVVGIAKEGGISVSQLLLANVDIPDKRSTILGKSEQLDRIESKLDRLLVSPKTGIEVFTDPRKHPDAQPQSEKGVPDEKNSEAPQEIKDLKGKIESMGGFVKKDGTCQPETNTQFSALAAEWVDQYFKPMPKKVKK